MYWFSSIRSLLQCIFVPTIMYCGLILTSMCTYDTTQGMYMSIHTHYILYHECMVKVAVYLYLWRTSIFGTVWPDWGVEILSPPPRISPPPSPMSPPPRGRLKQLAPWWLIGGFTVSYISWDGLNQIERSVIRCWELHRATLSMCFRSATQWEGWKVEFMLSF